MTTQIVVCGSMAYDFISPYEKPFEQVILPEKLSELSVCFLVHEKVKQFGGTGGNIAFSISLLGETPALVGAVGYDCADYREHLSQKGVNLDHIQYITDSPTASAIILTDPNGNQISIFHPGAIASPPPDVTNLFKKAQVIIIAPDDINRMIKLANEAKLAQTPYFFDPGQNLPVLSAEQLVEAVSGAKGLFLNDYEFEMFKKKTHLDLIQILDLTEILVVTRGANGSEIFSRETGIIEPLKIPVAPPRQMVGPTGCGDAFRAGFLKGFVNKKPLLTCGKMGALMATYVVEQIGTQNHTVNEEHFSYRYMEAFGERLP